MNVEVSNGEIADKVSILMIKAQKIHDPDKMKNIAEELEALSVAFGQIVGHPSDVFKKEGIWELFFSLKNINEKLWNIEDKIREKEKNKQFDAEFIELARSVYMTNDKRSKIKAEINKTSHSRLLEEKSYSDYLSQ